MTNNDLINKIKRLKNEEPRDAWLKSNREFIFKYIDLDDKNEPAAQNGSIFNVLAIRDRARFALSIFQNRMLTGAVAMAAIFILAGSFVTGKAEGSLPGDNFYAVKTFMEKAQLAFAFNDEERVALNFELTEKRLDEFSAVAAKKDENSSEVRTAADNLKNQLKVAAQELNSAKNNSSAEKAVSVAKIADTKTTAYAKKLNNVKKELSVNKQAQVSEVVFNIEELNNSALAVLATNSKIGDLNIEEIAAKLIEKIISAEAKIDLIEKNVSLYEAEIANSGAENIEAIESSALSVKLINEARAVLAEAQLSFEAGNFAKTWDLLVNAGNIVKVAEDVGNRVAVAPNPSLQPSPSSSAEAAADKEATLGEAEPAVSPLAPLAPSGVEGTPKPPVSPSPTV
ncbi:hypothetical protein KKE99_00380, partial [Patescibacteria group bacterium]|nr:hypothetical protein [Patescibacteria group bacterium]